MLIVPSPSLDKNKGSTTKTYSRKSKGDETIKGKRRSLKHDTQKSPQHNVEETTESENSKNKEENLEEEENENVGDFSSNLDGYPDRKGKSGKEDEEVNSEENTGPSNVGDEGN